MKVVPDTMMWVSYATHADGAHGRVIEQVRDVEIISLDEWLSRLPSDD
jgi:hypothetical protein